MSHQGNIRTSKPSPWFYLCRTSTHRTTSERPLYFPTHAHRQMSRAQLWYILINKAMCVEKYIHGWWVSKILLGLQVRLIISINSWHQCAHWSTFCRYIAASIVQGWALRRGFSAQHSAGASVTPALPFSNHPCCFPTFPWCPATAFTLNSTLTVPPPASRQCILALSHSLGLSLAFINYILMDPLWHFHTCTWCVLVTLTLQ